MNPLAGLALVEVSSFVASPTAGLYCAQLGAEVIRVDQIGGGQDFRRWPVNERGDSFAWENLNRAKRSLALDLARPEGRELLAALVAKVGTLLTNLPAGGFLAHEPLAARRADLITARIMGWPDGTVALDFTANAAVGYPLLTGPEALDADVAVNHLLPAWDLVTGAYAAFALLAAVRRRELTGAGGEVRIALTDVAIGTAANLGRIAEVTHTGRERPRHGNAVYGAIGRDFRTADGVRVMIVAINERQWAGLVRALALEGDVARIEREAGVLFAGDEGARFVHRAPLFAAIERAVAGLSEADLAARLGPAGVVHGRYQTMVEAADDPRLVGQNPLFAPVADNPSGMAYPAAGAFAALAGEARTAPRPAPRIGEHTEAVLAETLGLGSGEIARLIDQRIAGVAA